MYDFMSACGTIATPPEKLITRLKAIVDGPKLPAEPTMLEHLKIKIFNDASRK